MLIAAVAVAFVALAQYLAFQPQWSGDPRGLGALFAVYLLLSAWGIGRMWRDGVLAERLRPRSGDLSFGAFIATMLFFGALAGRLLFTPHGSGREGWLMRIYLQLGNPDLVQKHIVSVSLAVAVVAALEELTFRGLVFSALEERLGTRRAWPLTAVLYALAHAPTAILLRDPFAGPNPLLVVAALGCGLIWGLLVAKSGRLPVAMFSHAMFSWAVAVQFPLWRLG